MEFLSWSALELSGESRIRTEGLRLRPASGDAMVTVLEGTGRFTVGGQVFLLSEGETLVMPKDIPHAVFGEEKFKMQLIVSY